MRSAYRVLALLIALGVFVQAASMAFAVFEIFNVVDEGTVFDKAYVEDIHGENPGIATHGIVGMGLIPLLSLSLLIVSFFAKMQGGVKFAGLILLAVVVQIALVFVAFGAPIVGALHGINALVILGLAISAARRASIVTLSKDRDPADESVGARAV